MLNYATVVVSISLAFGCSRTLGQTRLDDGRELVVEGRGSKTNLSVKCLTEAEIKQLTGSSINPNVPKATCYTTVFVASDSSSISKAITAYTRAESELNDKVADIVTGGQGTVAATAGASIAKKLLKEEILKEGAVDQPGVRGAIQPLDAQTKSEVKTTLKDIADKTADPSTKAKVNALVESVK